MVMKSKLGSLRSGFTLMELLIVICIIGILAGLVVGGAVRLIGSAVEKRNKTNADRLRAAIVEFWHDTGKWPVPDNAKPVLSNAGSVTTSVGENDEEHSKDVFSYQIVLDYRNSIVVGKLLEHELEKPDGGSGGPTKTFLDLHGFSAPAGDAYKPKKDDLFVHEVVDAWGAWKGTESNEEGETVGPVPDPILCFFGKVVRCPHCGGYDAPSTTECSNDNCPFLGDAAGDWTKPKYRYRYTSEDKGRAEPVGIPFTITFDLDNNDVRVEAKMKKKSEEP